MINDKINFCSIDKNHKTSAIDRIIWVLTVAWIGCSYMLSTESYGAYVLLAITIVIFAFYCLQNRFCIKFKRNMLFVFMAAFAFFCIFSAVWSLDVGNSIQQCITITEILICIFVFYVCFQNDGGVWRLLNAVKWAGFLVVIYAFLIYGIDGMRAAISAGERLGTEFANINSIGMVAGISVIITAYEQLFKKINLIAILFGLLNIVVIAATGSRKALIVLVLGVILLILFRFAGKNILSTLLRFAIIGIILVFALRIILSLDIFSGVMERFEGFFALFTGEGKVDASTDQRADFIAIGLNRFFESPILGWGMGSSGEILLSIIGRSTYLHNNYIEIMCGGGIVGLLMYYSMYAYCIYFLLKSKLHDPLSKLVIVLIIINLILDFAAVSYTSKSTYIYFLIFFLQINTVKGANKKDEYKKVTQSHKQVRSELGLSF